MALANRIKNTVTNTLIKYGINASWAKTDKVNVPGTGEVTATPATGSPWAVKISPPSKVVTFIDGELIETNEFKSVISSNLSFTPELNDKVTVILGVDSRTYTVLRMTELVGGVATDGTNLIVGYTLFLVL